MAAATAASSLPGAELTFEFLSHQASQQDSGWGDTPLPPLCQPCPLWKMQHRPRTLGGKGTVTLFQEVGGGWGFPESHLLRSGWKAAQRGKAYRDQRESSV